LVGGGGQLRDRARRGLAERDRLSAERYAPNLFCAVFSVNPHNYPKKAVKNDTITHRRNRPGGRPAPGKAGDRSRPVNPPMPVKSSKKFNFLLEMYYFYIKGGFNHAYRRN